MKLFVVFSSCIFDFDSFLISCVICAFFIILAIELTVLIFQRSSLVLFVSFLFCNILFFILSLSLFCFSPSFLSWIFGKKCMLYAFMALIILSGTSCWMHKFWNTVLLVAIQFFIFSHPIMVQLKLVGEAEESLFQWLY